MAATRDLRIDFFRGLALLIVLVDHVEGWASTSVAENWTLIGLGFSDAAEIFVFLSGFVFATAYSRTLDRQGLSATLRKATKRSLQIYGAYVAASLTVIAIGAATLRWNPPTLNDAFHIGQRVWESLLAALTLRFHPFGFDILAFYVPILPVMALLLYLQRKSAPLAWLLSGGLYLAVQVEPALNLGRFPDGEPWYFNPFAWQFLFFLGIFLGDPARSVRIPIPRRVLMSAAVAMLALGLYTLKIGEYLVRRDPTLYSDALPLFEFYWTWAIKTQLGPLRLAHFFALVYVASQLLPRELPLWNSRAVRPLVVSGQHSLEVYAFGLVTSFLGAFAILSGASSVPAVLAIDAAACGASLTFGYGVRWWKTRAGERGKTASQGVSMAPHEVPAGSRRTRQKPAGSPRAR